jgi:hypothetical protein
MNFSPVEKQRIMSLIPPSSGTPLNSTGTYVSLKYVNKAYLVINVNNQGTEGITVTPYQASAIAGTGAKTLSTSVDIWVSSSRSDAPVKRTPATTWTFSTSTGALPHPKTAIFEIDPGLAMDTNNGFDCLGIQVVATTSICSFDAFALLDLRYGASAVALTSD